MQDQRKDTSEGTDQIENVESFKFNDGEIKLEELNKGPVLTGEKTRFINGTEDKTYRITKEELLRGFSDDNEDPLNITSLKVSKGRLNDNHDGSWILSSRALSWKS